MTHLSILLSIRIHIQSLSIHSSLKHEHSIDEGSVNIIRVTLNKSSSQALYEQMI